MEPQAMLDFAVLGPALMSAFVVGFLGGAHCIGMCGGIMSALSFSLPNQSMAKRWQLMLSYNLGRISSYGMIGLVGGWLGSQFMSGGGLSVARLIAGLLLIAMGLYLAGWWRGLTKLEKLGGYLWRYLQPLGSRLMPVSNAPTALLLGAIWGWLPCGLVYTALALALVQSEAVAAAAVMVAFGLGTLPSLLLAGAMAERMKALLQRRGFRTVMALCIMGFGVWTLWFVFQHARHDHAQHMDHSAHSMHGEAGVQETVDHSSQHHTMDHSAHQEMPESTLSDMPDHSHHHHMSPAESSDETP